MADSAVEKTQQQTAEEPKALQKEVIGKYPVLSVPNI